jgi:hypothetical protein
MLVSIVLASCIPARAADVRLYQPPSYPVPTVVVVEGDIVPGDYEKLRNIIGSYGPDAGSSHLPVGLFSKGGDPVEAMRMGRLVRRLKMVTETPPESMCPIARDPSNCVCASACFLVFVGGVDHELTSNIFLHRPYLTPGAMRAVTPNQQEAAQKQIMTSVREYLAEMEVPPKLTDIMMSISSTESHRLTWQEMHDSGFKGRIATVDEVIASRCAPMGDNDSMRWFTLRKTPTRTVAQEMEFKQITERLECPDKVMDAMRKEAFEKEWPRN